MALDSFRQGLHGRRPSIRGAAYFYVREGVETAAKWPKGRGKRIHPTTKERMEWLREVNWCWKFTWAPLQNDYRRATEHSPLLPRDLFTAAMAGRLAYVQLPDGKRVFSMAQLQDASGLLDIINQIEGRLLVRGPDLWQGLEPLQAGYVLTSNGPDAIPEFKPASGGGGGAASILPFPHDGGLNPLTGSNAIGTPVLVLVTAYASADGTVNGIYLPVLAGGLGRNAEPCIYQGPAAPGAFGSPAGAARLGAGPAVALANSTIAYLPFSAPVPVTARTLYYIGVTITGPSGNVTLMRHGANRQQFYAGGTFSPPPDPLPAVASAQNNNVGFWAD